MTEEELIRKLQNKEIQYREYIPMDGERWDNISHGLWDNPWLYGLIKQLNPELMGREVLYSSDRVRLPKLKTQPQHKYELPPWRRT